MCAESSSPAQTVKTIPWEGAQPHMKSVMSEAQKMYGKGTGAGVWQGPRYVAPTEQELSGLKSIENISRNYSNSLFPHTLQNARNMLSDGGVSDDQRHYLGAYNNVITGRQALDQAGYSNAAFDSQHPSMSAMSLFSTALGNNVGRSNPHLMGVLDTAADRAADRVDSMFAGSGRYASGAHQGTVADSVGDIYATGLSNQMNQDLNRQMQAAGQIDSASQGQMSQRLQALGGLAGVQGANIANIMGATGAAQDVFGQGNQLALQYSAMAPMINDMRYADAQKLVDTGAALRGENQAELDAQIQKFYEQQNIPWDQLGKYSNAVQGYSSQGSTKTTTAPKGSAIAGLLGGGLAGGGLYASLLSGGMAANPLLGLALAGGGGLLGAFS